MADAPVEEQAFTATTDEGKKKIKSIELKRQITIKSRVTGAFKEKAGSELSDELKLISSQMEQLETQYQSTLKQLEDLAQQGQNVAPQLNQLNQEVQQKRAQLSNVKMQVSSNLANLDKVEDGGLVTTGVLENYVEVKVGDNIYQRLRGAEIVIEDGVVKEILG